MVLQNRVTPFGDIVADSARGAFMGNRGILHDAATRTLAPRKRWAHKAWINCLCAFRGRRRTLMAPGQYTELFFLDEATALSAGHRPCFECRRGDALRFQAAWADGNGGEPPKAAAMDAVLHAERLDGRAKRLHPLPCAAEDLPDGTMVADGDQALLIRNGRAWRWSFSGYAGHRPPPAGLRLLTPPSTVRALRAGYVPAIDSSALHYPSAAGN